MIPLLLVVLCLQDVEGLIRQLGDEEPAVRDRATAELRIIQFPGSHTGIGRPLDLARGEAAESWRSGKRPIRPMMLPSESAPAEPEAFGEIPPGSTRRKGRLKTPSTAVRRAHGQLERRFYLCYPPRLEADRRESILSPW